ncbi:unnamed protein product, partial [marine sediment metagenome]
DFFGQSYPPNEPDPVNELLPFLASLGSKRHLPLALNLHLVGKTLDEGRDYRGLYYADYEGQDGDPEFEALLNWLANEPFETAADRRRLLHKFDTFFHSGRKVSDVEHQSPKAIAKIVAALARPKPGDRIYDPAFGAAKMLSRIVSEAGDAESGGQSSGSDNHSIQIFGTEINANSFVVGLARLVLAGIEDPHLEIGNSLERELPKDSSSNGYDLVVADPPFGARVDRELAQGFPVRSRDVSSLFVQHALANSGSNGRVIIVLPDGFFFRGGPDQ